MYLPIALMTAQRREAWSWTARIVARLFIIPMAVGAALGAIVVTLIRFV